MPGKRLIVRDTTAGERRIERRIRGELERGKAGVSDVIRSERTLAAEFGVSRRTVRRALKQLVADGYLVSRPRGGYEVMPNSANRRAPGAIAFVHGSAAEPWEWSEFNLAMWNGFQHEAAAMNKKLMVINLGQRSPRELAEQIKSHGVAGAIIDSDAVEVADAVRDAGMAVVQIDAIHPRAPSVIQDNFRGALEATESLLSAGCRRVAFAGCDFRPNPNRIHLEERLGGYLAAMNRVGIEVPSEWRIIGKPDEIMERLKGLLGGPGAPDGLVALWPELIDGLRDVLVGLPRRPRVVVWWGCVPGRRERWMKKSPSFPVPAGIEWSAKDMACAAFSKMHEILEGRNENPCRTIVPAHLTPGEIS